MRKLIMAIAAMLVLTSAGAVEKKYEVASPDGSLKAEISVADGRILYSVFKGSDVILALSEISMQLADGTAYDGAVRLQKTRMASVDTYVDALFYKKSKVKDSYNQLSLEFKTFSLVFRAYDAGLAYRFVSKSKVPFKVTAEKASFVFPEDWNMYVPYVKDKKPTLEEQFFNSFENTYVHGPLSSWDKERLAFLPLMVESPKGFKVNVMESALTDYPGMYLYNSDADTSLEAVFAPYPKNIRQGGHNNLQGVVESREDYIASYDGAVSFPWRIINVSAEDKDMLDNDLVWLLGEPAQDTDWSWVKPGKVAWEWWNNWHITGVDFKAGVNNDTYRHYIDFASRYGIEYVILDEGWAVKGAADLFNVVPEIDIRELVEYGAERNVGIVLWAGYWAFDRDMEKVCAHYSEMGVKGWKIDFMDRDDQMMVDFYTRAAATAAKYRQFVDFHGAYKPCGLNRTYPNVLNYEGVHGQEQMKWSPVNTDQIGYDVTFPFIRMAAGPVDYTQGAMKNASLRWYKPNYIDPVGQGTRCHQLGMYVIFESPFNMLCDAPQYYEREAECTGFISKVPTVWDETIAIDGKVGGYIVMARRSGDVWYVGGLTGHEGRTVTVNLDFLGEGDWKVELFKDGVNAERHAEDYSRTEAKADGSLTVNMVPGGGFAARISKSASYAQVRSEVLKSPDGNLALTFNLSEDGRASYSLDYKGRPVVLKSRLGYELKGNASEKIPESYMHVSYDTLDFSSGFVLADVDFSTFDETWEPVWGEEACIRNHYNEMAVTLRMPDFRGKSGADACMVVRFRLFDDGLGFRYEFPQQKDLKYFTLKDELTEFRMTGDHMAFWVAGDYDTQEYNYAQTRLSEVRETLPKMIFNNASQHVVGPTAVQTSLQMKTDDGLYVNIHEAALHDYPAMTLILNDEDYSFKADLTPDATGWRGRLCAPCTSPWRTVMVVDDARKVLSSRIILNLNDPCALEDVSWIHPVKFMGVWWEMITGSRSWAYGSSLGHGAETENVKRYIDFAAEHGFDALLVEGWNEGWRDWFGNQKDEVFDFVTPFPDFDLPGLNAYAHSKGIKLMMHHETSSSVVNYERHMEEAFDLMNEYGYDAVKTGYVGDIIPYGEHHYGQFMVNHYNRVLKKAAEHRIMVNGHEAVHPTGICRTYPNLVGNESAMGMEFRSRVLPHHVTILPFTRLQGGPMDFTPGIFEHDMSRMNPKSQQQIHSTICKQLALYVTQASPIQMAGDIPDNYMKHMDAFQFIKDVALDWQKSVYLAAEPGDYVVTARQAKGSGEWFVGGVTDENAREMTVSFDFLEPGRNYVATIYRDAPDADGVGNTFETGSESCSRYEIEEKNIDSNTELKLRMAPSGGFAISLKIYN